MPLKAESPRFCDTIRSLLLLSRSQHQMKRKSPAMGGTVKLGEAPRCIKEPCFQIKRAEQKAGRRKDSPGSCCLAHLHSPSARLVGQPPTPLHSIPLGLDYCRAGSVGFVGRGQSPMSGPAAVASRVRDQGDWRPGQPGTCP